ncbi:hypothetical protein A0H81_08974 [Grifola frondosa]|uniref:Uncharacterized protein n=1 Tax=Grifola frondosa TaxID=5627 RepID=A0A1C7M3T9_GRIFR|nr:hypothetical protein A0H81_08974 [Grifola frondosa]
MTTRNRFFNSVHGTHPDDDSIKAVYLQAHGLQWEGLPAHRHVLLWWYNSPNHENPVIQIIQLTGEAGNYNYYSPVVTSLGAESYNTNLQITLGQFSRAQRDRILELANNVSSACEASVRGLRNILPLGELFDICERI